MSEATSSQQKGRPTNAINVTTSETIRVDGDRNNLHLQPMPIGSVSGQVGVGTTYHKKKTTSFQITSVTSRDGGEDSADDTEDLSEIMDSSKVTDFDQETPTSFSEDTYSKSEDVFFGPAPVIPTSSQYGITALVQQPGTGGVMTARLPQGVTVNVTEGGIALAKADGEPDDVEQWQNRFKIVKIDSTEPFKRGRWTCLDFMDSPAGTANACPSKDDVPSLIVNSINSREPEAPEQQPQTVLQVCIPSANQQQQSSVQQPTHSVPTGQYQSQTAQAISGQPPNVTTMVPTPQVAPSLVSIQSGQHGVTQQGAPPGMGYPPTNVVPTQAPPTMVGQGYATSSQTPQGSVHPSPSAQTPPQTQPPMQQPQPHQQPQAPPQGISAQAPGVSQTNLVQAVHSHPSDIQQVNAPVSSVPPGSIQPGVVPSTSLPQAATHQQQPGMGTQSLPQQGMAAQNVSIPQQSGGMAQPAAVKAQNLPQQNLPQNVPQQVMSGVPQQTVGMAQTGHPGMVSQGGGQALPQQSIQPTNLTGQVGPAQAMPAKPTVTTQNIVPTQQMAGTGAMPVQPVGGGAMPAVSSQPNVGAPPVSYSSLPSAGGSTTPATTPAQPQAHHNVGSAPQVPTTGTPAQQSAPPTHTVVGGGKDQLGHEGGTPGAEDSGAAPSGAPMVSEDSERGVITHPLVKVDLVTQPELGRRGSYPPPDKGSIHGLVRAPVAPPSTQHLPPKPAPSLAPPRHGSAPASTPVSAPDSLTPEKSGNSASNNVISTSSFTSPQADTGEGRVLVATVSVTGTTTVTPPGAAVTPASAATPGPVATLASASPAAGKPPIAVPAATAALPSLATPCTVGGTAAAVAQAVMPVSTAVAVPVVATTSTPTFVSADVGVSLAVVGSPSPSALSKESAPTIVSISPAVAGPTSEGQSTFQVTPAGDAVGLPAQASEVVLSVPDRATTTAVTVPTVVAASPVVTSQVSSSGPNPAAGTVPPPAVSCAAVGPTVRAGEAGPGAVGVSAITKRSSPAIVTQTAGGSPASPVAAPKNLAASHPRPTGIPPPFRAVPTTLNIAPAVPSPTRETSPVPVRLPSPTAETSGSVVAGGACTGFPSPTAPTAMPVSSVVVPKAANAAIASTGGNTPGPVNSPVRAAAPATPFGSGVGGGDSGVSCGVEPRATLQGTAPQASEAEPLVSHAPAGSYVASVAAGVTVGGGGMTPGAASAVMIPRTTSSSTPCSGSPIASAVPNVKVYSTPLSRNSSFKSAGSGGSNPGSGAWAGIRRSASGNIATMEGAGGSSTPSEFLSAPSQSASNASTVAIDNKIEQAMDLVKSHLMFAVREEVEVLKEKIGELMDRISQLEYENTVLRQCATQDALQQISQQHPSSNT